MIQNTLTDHYKTFSQQISHCTLSENALNLTQVVQVQTNFNVLPVPVYSEVQMSTRVYTPRSTLHTGT